MGVLRWFRGLFRKDEPRETTCKCPWCATWSPLRTWVETADHGPCLSEIECPYCRAASFWDLDAPVPILMHQLAILPRETGAPS